MWGPMAVTLSHQSALDAIRTLRAAGTSVHEMEVVSLASPSPWVGKRLSRGNFDPAVWQWGRPEKDRPLHILVPTKRERVRSACITAHVRWGDLPAGSILWLDEHASVVCPELLFLQMASSFSLPALVMLGLELCGHFSRDANEPLTGAVIDGLPAATSVANLEAYLAQFQRVPGLVKAREALHYISDHAVSAPEAVLAGLYALPPEEGGYGFGEVQLNDRVRVDDSGVWGRAKHRYPDLMFGFAPLGLNYDGSKHFDLPALMKAVNALAQANEESRSEAYDELRKELVAVRAKVLDDNLRDRELMAQGRVVFPVTKEDLADGTHLDALTRQVLGCARTVFGVDTNEYESVLDDTALTRDRWALLDSLSPRRRAGETSYGKM